MRNIDIDKKPFPSEMLKYGRLFNDKEYFDRLINRYGNSIFYIENVENGNTVLHELITKRCSSETNTRRI